jgi:hypothetical protein
MDKDFFFFFLWGYFVLFSFVGATVPPSECVDPIIIFEQKSI